MTCTQDENKGPSLYRVLSKLREYEPPEAVLKAIDMGLVEIRAHRFHNALGHLTIERYELVLTDMGTSVCKEITRALTE